MRCTELCTLESIKGLDKKALIEPRRKVQCKIETRPVVQE
jgi:hypothetical protein